MRSRSFLVFGCLHLPVSHQGYCDWVVETVAERQPDILVINGDLIDCEALSSYENSSSTTLKDEYDKVNSFVGRLNDVVPANTEKVYIGGNHEHRLQRPQFKKISDLLDFRLHCPVLSAFRTLDYEYHPRSVYSFGQLTVAHGFSVSEAGARAEAIGMGKPNGLYVYSHIHRGFGPTQQRWGQVKLPYWLANTGCGIDNPPDSYFRTWNTSNWNRGMIVGHAAVRPNYSRPCWSAEFLKHSSLWDT